MKIVGNNVKCGEIITFDLKFYQKTRKFPSNFVPVVEIFSKMYVLVVRFWIKTFLAHESAGGLPVKVMPS